MFKTCSPGLSVAPWGNERLKIHFFSTCLTSVWGLESNRRVDTSLLLLVSEGERREIPIISVNDHRL